MMVYTLAFIQYQDELLLVNREKHPWLGCWNGLGGKIEQNESKEVAMLRELKEETGIIIQLEQLIYKGKMTWNTSEDYLYMFLIHQNSKIETPIKTPEGLLDYKKIKWLLNDNLGVAHNIPYFIESLLNEEKIYDYHCTFDGNRLLSVDKKEVL